jgi:hypothetical protein
MIQNARVAWVAVDKPWDLEHRLLSTVALPLNLRDNVHPFVSTLQQIRRDAKLQAMELQVVADNGGPRRLPI